MTQGLNHILDYVNEHPNEVEMQALLQQNAHTSPSTHPFRGFAILNQSEKTTDVKVGCYYNKI